MTKFGTLLAIFSCLAATVLAETKPATEAKPAAAPKPATAPASAGPVVIEPSASQLILARQTVKAVGLTRQIDAVIVQFRQLAAKQAAEIAPANATEAQKKALADFQVSLQALANESAMRMLSTYENAYLAVFSPVELAAICNFYQSPEGQAFMDKQPQLARAIGPSLQQLQTELNQKLAALVQQARKEAGLPDAPAAASAAPQAPAPAAKK